jgi:phage-related protein
MAKELRWRGSTQADLSSMPTGVRRSFDTKLRYLAASLLPSGIKSWKGCGTGAMEFSSGGYRMVVTNEFEDAVDVLHVFKKDGLRGRKTRAQDTATALRRYKYICEECAVRARKH